NQEGPRRLPHGGEKVEGPLTRRKPRDERREPLHAEREAYAGRGRPAHLFDKVVIAATCDKGFLRTKLGRGHFEDRARVIIEAPDETLVQGIGDAEAIKPVEALVEMPFAPLAEIIEKHGGILDGLAALRHLAVE